MSSNPFQPPAAPPAEPLAQPIKLWQTGGRLGRVRLIAYAMAANLLLLPGIALSTMGGMAGVVPLVLAWCAFLVISVIVVVQRSHDLDLSGWWSVVYFVVPLAALYWLIAPGSKGPNRFGLPPVANSLGVVLLAWLLPLFIFGGMAAAVALPAYRDYTIKAKLAEVVNQLAPCRERVTRAYQAPGQPDADATGCVEGGPVGRHATQLSVDRNGVISVTLQGIGATEVDGQRLALVPVDGRNRVLSAAAAPATVARFRCQVAEPVGLPLRMLPANCRGD